MKIGVDLQTLGRGRTGDETYYRNLVSHYSSLRPEYEFYLYYTEPGAEPYFSSLRGNYHPRRLAFQSPFLRVPFAYRRMMRQEPVDVFHSQYVGFAPARTKLVLTIHDLSFELYPEMFPRNRALFLKLTRWSAGRADAVIVVSEHTKKDLLRLYGIPEEKVHMIFNAAHPRFAPCRNPERLQAVKHRFQITKGYILSVGSLQPRKNIARLIDAYLRARTDKSLDVQLVISGKDAWGDAAWKAAAERSPYAADVIFTGHVADEDLPVLYSGAAMFVYPSLYEGFGLPVLEAMACGTPVITSNVSSLPEVGGGAVVYVDPYDVQSMTKAMVAVAQDPEWRQKLSALGLERARHFSWERSAEKTMGVYESVMRQMEVSQI